MALPTFGKFIEIPVLQESENQPTTLVDRGINALEIIYYGSTTETVNGVPRTGIEIILRGNQRLVTNASISDVRNAIAAATT